MPVGKPDIYQHNNQDLAFVDSDMVRGGVRKVATISDLTALNAKADQLKENVSLVYVESETKFYLLTDDSNINSTSGWTEFSAISGGGGASSLDDLSDVSLSAGPAAGSVLVYNDTTDVFVDTTLQAGTDITITNADGAITIASTASGGTGNVNVNGTPVDNQLAVWYNSDTIEGDADLTWNGTRLDVSGTVKADGIDINGQIPSTILAGDYQPGSRLFRRFSSQSGLTAGKVYYLGSSGWALAQANSGATASGLLCVVPQSGSGSETLASGLVKVATSPAGNVGDLVYLSPSTPGEVTTTRPSASTHIVRIVGYLFNTSRDVIYFDPSQDYIELS